MVKKHAKVEDAQFYVILHAQVSAAARGWRNAALRALHTAAWISRARVLRFAARLKKIILQAPKLQN